MAGEEAGGGVVTKLDEFIAKFTPEVQKLARAALRKMRKRLPGAVQLVYDNYNALAIAFSATDRRSDIVLSIALYPRWVSLFFMHGGALVDPQKLLRGSGKTVRHIVLADASDLEQPPLEALIAAAVERADPPIDPSRRARAVVKLALKKQRPRRPRA
jgi:hypothetical protein